MYVYCRALNRVYGVWCPIFVSLSFISSTDVNCWRLIDEFGVSLVSMASDQLQHHSCLTLFLVMCVLVSLYACLFFCLSLHVSVFLSNPRSPPSFFSSLSQYLSLCLCLILSLCLCPSLSLSIQVGCLQSLQVKNLFLIYCCNISALAENIPSTVEPCN